MADKDSKAAGHEATGGFAFVPQTVLAVRAVELAAMGAGTARPLNLSRDGLFAAA
jgi:hypothetical protein